jgi:porin
LIYSKISDTFNAAYFNQGLPVLGSEKAMELTYLFQITPWWVLQPDYQHYWSLGANPKSGNASILGFRVSVLF